MGKSDRDQRQALYAVLEKAWKKWVGSYSKPNVYQKKLPKISTADDSDSEYDVSDWLLEEDTWGDETNKEIAFTSNFFYDDSEIGKWVLYSHLQLYTRLLNYIYIYIQVLQWKYPMFGNSVERIEGDWSHPLSGTAMREPWKT